VTDPEQVNGLLAGLARRGVTEVDASTLSRGLYASDASLYRVVPAAVVRPRHVDEVLATVEVAAEHELPVTSRGAGTSCAGNAIGPGVVIDFARHLNRIGTVQRNEPGQGGYGMRGSRGGGAGAGWAGQLDAARRVLGRTMLTLAVRVDAGDLVLGLEPSCTAVLRDDAVRLLRGTERSAAARVAAATRTLAELLLAAPNWNPPDLSGAQVVVQPHCHHASVLGWQADAEVLASTGVSVRRVGGCCGLAGNFGVETGHHDVSVAIAEQQLLPAVRTAQPGAWVLADGFSCRTQLADLAGISAVHLADFLDSASSSHPAL